MASSKFSEADVIQNRIAIALAKSQRLVASWLPAAKSSIKTTEELEKEEAAIFAPMPPRLGLGAPLPKEFEEGTHRTRKELSKDERLRQRMLGKRAGHRMSKPMPKTEDSRTEPRNKQESSGDEDEGRTGLGKSKRRKVEKSMPTKVEDETYGRLQERQSVAQEDHPSPTAESPLVRQSSRTDAGTRKRKKKKKSKHKHRSRE